MFNPQRLEESNQFSGFKVYFISILLNFIIVDDICAKIFLEKGQVHSVSCESEKKFNA